MANVSRRCSKSPIRSPLGEARLEAAALAVVAPGADEHLGGLDLAPVPLERGPRASLGAGLVAAEEEGLREESLRGGRVLGILARAGARLELLARVGERL